MVCPFFGHTLLLRAAPEGAADVSSIYFIHVTTINSLFTLHSPLVAFIFND